MSSQELPSSPKSPARTYASKKRGEKPAAKAKRKANSDDDTRDSAEDPAVVKETPQKEEGYGTEPDRESPAKREGSPDLDSEPLNSPAAGKKKTLSLKNKPAFDDEDEVKASQGDKAKDKAPAGEKPKPAAAAKGKEAKAAEKEGSQKEKKDEKEKPAAVAKPAEPARPEKRVLALDDESDKKDERKEEKKDDKKEERKEEKKDEKKADKKHSAKKAAAKRKADDVSDKEDGAKAKASAKEAKEAKEEEKEKEEAKEEKKEEAKKPAAAKRAKKEDKEEAEVAKPKSPAKPKKAKESEKADKKEKKEESAKDKKSKDKKDEAEAKKEAKRASEHDKSAEKEKPAKKAKNAEESASASKGSDKKAAKEKDGKAKKKGRIEVAISGGEGAEKAELESVVTKRLGGVVVEEVKKSCTAVLLLSEKRTFKVLHALALGVPLVKAEWALASLDGERPLSEFSAKSWFRGTAVTRPKGGMLANTKVYVERGVKGVPEESLKALLVAAGAELVSWSRDAEYSVLNAGSKISPEQSKAVAPSFFLDALTTGALPSPSSHRPGTA